MVDLSTRVGVGGCGCPSSCRVVLIGHGLLAIVKSGTDFGFSGGRHHVLGDLGDCMDRAVERRFRERWLGRVSGFVAK